MFHSPDTAASLLKIKSARGIDTEIKLRMLNSGSSSLGIIEDGVVCPVLRGWVMNKSRDPVTMAATMGGIRVSHLLKMKKDSRAALPIIGSQADLMIVNE